jgi:hypothetical protein
MSAELVGKEENEAGETEMGISLAPGVPGSFLSITRRFAFANCERLGWWRESAAAQHRRRAAWKSARGRCTSVPCGRVLIRRAWACGSASIWTNPGWFLARWCPLIRGFGRLHCP